MSQRDDFIDYLQTTVKGDGDHVHKVRFREVIVLREFLFDASGKFRVEIKINDATQMVGFRYHSAETDRLPRMITIRKTVRPGDTAEIKITNREKMSMDIYSTVKGEFSDE